MTAREPTGGVRTGGEPTDSDGTAGIPPGVDAHTHLDDHRLAGDLLDRGAALGIGTFLCSDLGDFGRDNYPSEQAVDLANRTMAAVVRDHPGRIAGYCYLNPRHGAAALRMLTRGIEDDGLVGIKLHVSVVCDDPMVEPIVEAAIGYRAPMLIHAWRKTIGQLPDESTAVNVARLAARYPEARIVMAHLGGQCESAVNAIAPFPNVLIDTSGTIIGAGEVALAVRRLGAGRVVFGSDSSPVACLAANVGKVLAADLTDDQARKVMGGTMSRLLSEVKR